MTNTATGMTKNKTYDRMVMDELSKLVNPDQLAILKEELEHFKKTKIPRCTKCKKNYKQVEPYVWQPDCDHLSKKMRLSIG